MASSYHYLNKSIRGALYYLTHPLETLTLGLYFSTLFAQRALAQPVPGRNLALFDLPSFNASVGVPFAMDLTDAFGCNYFNLNLDQLNLSTTALCPDSGIFTSDITGHRYPGFGSAISWASPQVLGNIFLRGLASASNRFWNILQLNVLVKQCFVDPDSGQPTECFSESLKSGVQRIYVPDTPPSLRPGLSPQTIPPIVCESSDFCTGGLLNPGDVLDPEGDGFQVRTSFPDSKTHRDPSSWVGTDPNTGRLSIIPPESAPRRVNFTQEIFDPLKHQRLFYANYLNDSRLVLWNASFLITSYFILPALSPNPNNTSGQNTVMNTSSKISDTTFGLAIAAFIAVVLIAGAGAYCVFRKCCRTPTIPAPRADMPIRVEVQAAAPEEIQEETQEENLDRGTHTPNPLTEQAHQAHQAAQATQGTRTPARAPAGKFTLAPIPPFRSTQPTAQPAAQPASHQDAQFLAGPHDSLVLAPHRATAPGPSSASSAFTPIAV